MQRLCMPPFLVSKKASWKQMPQKCCKEKIAIKLIDKHFPQSYNLTQQEKGCEKEE